MSYERIVRKEPQLEGEMDALRKNVDALLAEAERTNAQKDDRLALTVAAMSCPGAAAS